MLKKQKQTNTKAGHAVIWSWNYIWAIYLLKQLYLAQFRQVEAKTKHDRDRLNAALSATCSRGLWKSSWYYFQWFFTWYLFIYFFLWGLITGRRWRYKHIKQGEDLEPLIEGDIGHKYDRCHVAPLSSTNKRKRPQVLGKIQKHAVGMTPVLACCISSQVICSSKTRMYN